MIQSKNQGLFVCAHGMRIEQLWMKLTNQASAIWVFLSLESRQKEINYRGIYRVRYCYNKVNVNFIISQHHLIPNYLEINIKLIKFNYAVCWLRLWPQLAPKIKHKHSHGTYHSNGKNPFIISVSDWSTGDGGQWIVFAIQCKIIVI